MAVIRIGLTCLLALLATAACTNSVPTPSRLTPVFILDSGAVNCATESVGVELAIEHAVASPGYLDCITVTLRADPDGTIWLCEPVRDPAAPVCEGLRMELRGADLDQFQGTWHDNAGSRWSDPVQLLGRVRFL